MGAKRRLPPLYLLKREMELYKMKLSLTVLSHQQQKEHFFFHLKQQKSCRSVNHLILKKEGREKIKILSSDHTEGSLIKDFFLPTKNILTKK